MKAKTKKIVKVFAWIAAIWVLFTQVIVTSRRKMIIDVMDATSQFGREQRSYLQLNNAEINKENLMGGVLYRDKNPNDSIAKAYAKQKFWLRWQKVTY